MIWILNDGLKTGQKSVLWLKMSSIQMVRLLTWSGHLKSRQKISEISNVRIEGMLYSDGYCIFHFDILP